MNCEELLAGLNEYVDGETRPAFCQAIQKHLGDCNPCRIVIDNIRQTIALCQAGRVMPLPAGLHDRLRSMLLDRWTENKGNQE